jgi:hypothetical protein
MFVGIVPTGSIILRKATVADLRDDPSRIALYQSPDGKTAWLTMTYQPDQKVVELDDALGGSGTCTR